MNIPNEALFLLLAGFQLLTWWVQLKTFPVKKFQKKAELVTENVFTRSFQLILASGVVNILIASMPLWAGTEITLLLSILPAGLNTYTAFFMATRNIGPNAKRRAVLCIFLTTIWVAWWSASFTAFISEFFFS